MVEISFGAVRVFEHGIARNPRTIPAFSLKENDFPLAKRTFSGCKGSDNSIACSFPKTARFARSAVDAPDDKTHQQDDEADYR
jgi:hypothetical protein